MNDKYYSIEDIRLKMANYCAYQDRCHKEVEEKLKDFVLIEEVRGDIIIFLIQHDFLNEERFAMNYARGKFNQKKWGRIKIKQHLKFKNIPSKMIDKALSELDLEEYDATILSLIEKKNALLKEPNAYKRKAKIINYLQQKGFEYSIIRALMES